MSVVCMEESARSTWNREVIAESPPAEDTRLTGDFGVGNCGTRLDLRRSHSYNKRTGGREGRCEDTTLCGSGAVGVEAEAVVSCHRGLSVSQKQPPVVYAPATPSSPDAKSIVTPIMPSCTSGVRKGYKNTRKMATLAYSAHCLAAYAGERAASS